MTAQAGKRRPAEVRIINDGPGYGSAVTYIIYRVGGRPVPERSSVCIGMMRGMAENADLCRIVCLQHPAEAAEVMP